MGWAHPLTCFGLKCLADTLVVLDLAADQQFSKEVLGLPLKFLRAPMTNFFLKLGAPWYSITVWV